MSEIQSDNSPNPELDEETLIALEQLNWVIASQPAEGVNNVEVAIHDPGVIVSILGKAIMSRIIDNGLPLEDITVLIRVQNTNGPPLGYTDPEWDAFIDGCKANEFDFLTKPED